MKKSLAASKDLMKNYLSELLTEDEELAIEPEVKTKVKFKPKTDPVSTASLEKEQRLEKLLETVNVAKQESEKEAQSITSFKSERSVKPSAKQEVVETVEVKTAIVPEVELVTRKSLATDKVKTEKSYRKGSFQAMFFDVAGLTIAVPLIELGGIHNTDKTNSLMGKPDWFKGVMLHREEKINVVDTALWVMPEKCDEKLKSSLNYKYIIMLSDSNWGLMAETLVDTVTLEQDEVKWLDMPSKRPWLAGLVKDRMCALLDVEALIRLLNDGAGIQQD